MQILSSHDAFRYLARLINRNIEQFWIICLDSENKIIRSELLFQGTVDSCPVYIRDIIRTVCFYNASCFIISHNHPSGNPAPSMEDITITQRIQTVSQLAELRFLDHIILGDKNYYSFSDNGHWAKRNKNLKIRKSDKI